MSDTNKLLSLDSDLVESPKMNSQYHKQNDNDLRASVPYKFTPMNGAPSVRGKNIVHFQKKIRDSCSLASD